MKVESDLYFVEARTSGQACALTQAGRAYCWGANPFGERGDGTMGPDAPEVVAVATTGTFRQLTAGGNHTCGVTTDERALCWGANTRGQLGDGTTTNRSTPVAPTGDLAFQRISAGRSGVDNHTCAVTTDGDAYCWGPNDGGEAYCWGANGAGQLGDGTTSDRLEPVAVEGGLTFEAIAAGDRHTCALAEGGEPYCWGADASGQSTAPTAVEGGLVFEQLHAGAHHTCGVTPAGVAYCWGANDDGQLGNGTTTARQTPTRVLDPGGS